MPFHISQTCEEAAESRAAVHCRFCLTQLPKGVKEGSACDDEDCQKRKDQACDIVHKKCRHRSLLASCLHVEIARARCSALALGLVCWC
jgi:hypothetical protein